MLTISPKTSRSPCKKPHDTVGTIDTVSAEVCQEFQECQSAKKIREAPNSDVQDGRGMIARMKGKGKTNRSIYAVNQLLTR